MFSAGTRANCTSRSKATPTRSARSPGTPLSSSAKAGRPLHAPDPAGTPDGPDCPEAPTSAASENTGTAALRTPSNAQQRGTARRQTHHLQVVLDAANAIERQRPLLVSRSHQHKVAAPHSRLARRLGKGAVELLAQPLGGTNLRAWNHEAPLPEPGTPGSREAPAGCADNA